MLGLVRLRIYEGSLATGSLYLDRKKALSFISLPNDMVKLSIKSLSYDLSRHVLSRFLAKTL